MLCVVWHGSLFRGINLGVIVVEDALSAGAPHLRRTWPKLACAYIRPLRRLRYHPVAVKIGESGGVTLGGKKWDWLGLFERFPVPSRNVRQTLWFLRCQVRFADDGQPATANRTLWGLARRGGLDPSHPAFVTRHETTWKHAPFSRAPRVCLRLGVVQNQRFSGPHGRQLAPSWASSQKNPEKTIKNVLKNGAKWRFFGGLERHFAVPAADGARSQPASLPDLTSVASGCIEPAAAPEIGGRAPFFTCVGQAFQPDIRRVRLESLTYTGFG